MEVLRIHWLIFICLHYFGLCPHSSFLFFFFSKTIFSFNFNALYLFIVFFPCVIFVSFIIFSSFLSVLLSPRILGGHVQNTSFDRDVLYRFHICFLSVVLSSILISFNFILPPFLLLFFLFSFSFTFSFSSSISLSFVFNCFPSYQYTIYILSLTHSLFLFSADTVKLFPWIPNTRHGTEPIRCGKFIICQIIFSVARLFCSTFILKKNVLVERLFEPRHLLIVENFPPGWLFQSVSTCIWLKNSIYFISVSLSASFVTPTVLFLLLSI